MPAALLLREPRCQRVQLLLVQEGSMRTTQPCRIREHAVVLWCLFQQIQLRVESTRSVRCSELAMFLDQGFDHEALM